MNVFLIYHNRTVEHLNHGNRTQNRCDRRDIGRGSLSHISFCVSLPLNCRADAPENFASKNAIDAEIQTQREVRRQTRATKDQAAAAAAVEEEVRRIREEAAKAMQALEVSRWCVLPYARKQWCRPL